MSKARRRPIIRRSNPTVNNRSSNVLVDPLWTRANQTVMGMTSPLIKQLAEQRVRAEQNARQAFGTQGSALEGALQQSAAPLNTAYDTAIRSAAATEDAVANRLRSAGQTASQGLAAQLAQIQAPGQSALPGIYQGAEGAEFARGSADVQRLIGRGAEARTYAAKLPGIGRLAVNRDLSQALSEMGAEFGERERGLQEGALEQAFGLFNQYRGEQREDQRFVEEQKFAIQEQAAKERMALQALRTTATSKAEERMFDAQMKELDRQTRIDIANLNAQTRLATDNPPKPPSRTGPANQQWITVNGQVVKNPNYVKPSSTSKPKTTPKYVIDSVWNSVNADYNANSFRWPQEIYSKIKGSPRAIDGILNAHINNQIQAFNLAPAQAANLRRSILKKLNGRKWRDINGNIWTYEYGGK